MTAAKAATGTKRARAAKTPMTIKDIMSQPVVTCPTSETVNEAARLMWEFDCGMILVVNDDGRLAGVLTDRDACMAAYTQGRPLASIPIGSAMTKKVVAGSPDDSLETAEGLLRDNRIRRLPVLDRNGRPIGIVSLNDLARLVVRAKVAGPSRELVRTLAAICEPRPPEEGNLPAVV